MSQNKYLTISMVMCLVLCGVLCFLGTPLLKVQAETIEYTENVKVRHNANYVPTNPVVVPVQYDNYNSYGTYDYNGLWGYVNGSFSLYDSNFNIWDEQWETGSLDGSNGLPVVDSTRFRSTEFCSMMANQTYYTYCPDLGATTDPNVYVLFYDDSFNFISYVPTKNSSFTAPANTYYFKINPGVSFGAEYLHNISIYEVSSSLPSLPFYTPYIGSIDPTHYYYFSNQQVKGLNNCADYLTFIRPVSYATNFYDYIQIYWLDGSMNYLSVQYLPTDTHSLTSLIHIPSTAHYFYYSYIYDFYEYQQNIYKPQDDFILYSGYSYSAEYMNDFYNDLYNYSYSLGSTAGYDTGYDTGYNLGYGNGLDVGYDSGYENGYDAGTSVDVDTAYNNGYNTGFTAGQTDATDRQTLSFSTMIAGVFNSMGSFLSIEVFPGITIAFLIGLPLLLGVFLIILKLIRG